jgi:hypothetical protein
MSTLILPCTKKNKLTLHRGEIKVCGYLEISRRQAERLHESLNLHAARAQATAEYESALAGAIKTALRAYPGDDLLPVDYESLGLKELLAAARQNDFGDTLASFVVLELYEGMHGEPAETFAERGAELMYRGARQLETVGDALAGMDEGKPGAQAQSAAAKKQSPLSRPANYDAETGRIAGTGGRERKGENP